MHLYEAIRTVLEESGNTPMTIQEIADRINERQLFITDARKVGWRAVGDVSKSTTPLFDVLIRLRQQ
jgi:hypothetical protein